MDGRMGLRFVFHAAEHAALSVPEALAARILRPVNSLPSTYMHEYTCIYK